MRRDPLSPWRTGTAYRIHQRHRSGRKGFTLLELIVVLVVLGIIAGITIATFVSIINRSKDGAQQQTLSSLYDDALAYGKLNSNGTETVPTYADFQAVVGELASGTGVLASGGNYTTVQDPTPGNALNASTSSTLISVAVGGSTDGLAIKAPSGDCVFDLGSSSSNTQTWSVAAGSYGICDGQGALLGPSTNFESTTTTLATPSTPSGLAVSSSTSTSVSLTWTSLTATGYKIYTNGANPTTVTPGSASSTTITGLSPSTTYSFTISAYNGSGESAQSSGVNGTTTPPAPSGLAVSGSTSSSVSLTWTALGGSVTGYRIYVNGALSDQVTPNSASSDTISSLTANTTFTFTISAYSAAGEGPQSSGVNATTSIPGYGQNAISDSALAYWPLNETSGSTATDVTANGYSGPETSVTHVDTGPMGTGDKAATFNGSTSSVNTALFQPSTSAYTISAWFKNPGVGSGGVNGGYMATMVQDRSGSGGTYTFALTYGGTQSSQCTTGRVCFVLTGSTVQFGIGSSSTSLNDGNWHYVAGVWSGTSGTAFSTTQMKIYVDGALVSSPFALGSVGGAPTAPLPGGMVQTEFGNAGGSGLNNYSGDLADVGMWNSALSAGTISTLYSATAATADMPGAPISPSVSGTGPYSLSWSAATRASGYSIYRAAGGSSSYSLLGTTTSTNYTDSTASAGVSYNYEIAATDAAGSTPVVVPAFGTFGQDVLAQSPVGYYPLTEGSGAANNGAGGIPLGIIGGTSSSSTIDATLNEKGTTFNGTTGCATNFLSGSVGGGYTEAGWVDVAAWPTSAGADPMPFGTFFYYGDSGIGVRSDGHITLIYEGQAWAETSATLSLNTWYYVALTMTSGGSGTIYVNGTSVATTGSSISSASNIQVGCHTGTRYLNGSVGQAAFFNSVLSAANITTLYNASK